VSCMRVDPNAEVLPDVFSRLIFVDQGFWKSRRTAQLSVLEDRFSRKNPSLITNTKNNNNNK